METTPNPRYEHFYTCEEIFGKNGEFAIERKPRVTACYIAHGDHVAVGLAICSFMDNPSKKRGRAIALARAKYVLTHLKQQLRSSEDIKLLPTKRAEALDTLCEVGFDTSVHAKYTAKDGFPDYKAFVVKNTPDFRIGRKEAL